MDPIRDIRPEYPIFEPINQLRMSIRTFWAAKVTHRSGQAKELIVAALLIGLFSACTDANAPLDPKVRYRIDSIAAAQIQQAREELDSLCAQERTRRLPVLMDSIRRQRLREIERQLQTLPPQ